MTNTECVKRLNLNATTRETLTSNMICATDKDKNACNRDSGGPLAHFDHTYNYWMLIGVVSFGDPKAGLYGCNITEPTVFARVTAQLEWIQAHVSGQKCPRPFY